ncbi:MAG: pentapeptide repeat-containing protein [Myxococcota bacterium]|nr:pentapeptide repeat-containing protein [Myxococcota bacterium]
MAKDPNTKPKSYAPPNSAKELLRRYKKGERYLGEANLVGVDLSDADLQGGNFEGTNFEGANFHGAYLVEANLSRANLQRTNFYKARLIVANLEGANCEQANFEWANLQGADLKDASLAGANLAMSNFSSASLQNAKFNDKTIWSKISWNLETIFPVDFHPEDRINQNKHAVQDIYISYPTELVDKLDLLTFKRHKALKKGRQVEQSLKDEIRATTRKLNAFRPPRAGDTVANAELVEVVGSGNFGTVWEAIDETTGESVAVKILHADKIGLSLTLHHFRRGVEAMEKLTNAMGCPASVIKLLHVEPSRLAFSMPLVPDADLSKRIKGWSLSTKLAFFYTVCEAVKFAHTNQILHRDIKPENILVTDDLRPILTDFDICDLLYKKTLSAQATGTLIYASPEQLKGTTERKYHSDVYSLGRILHFLLLENDPDIRLGDIPKIDDLRGHPEGLIRIIRKCTLFDRSSRYQSVDALLSDLEKYESHPGKVGVGHPDVAVQTRGWDWFRHHPKAIAAIVPIIVAVIGGIFGLLNIVVPKFMDRGTPSTTTIKSPVKVVDPCQYSGYKLNGKPWPATGTTLEIKAPRVKVEWDSTHCTTTVQAIYDNQIVFSTQSMSPVVIDLTEGDEKRYEFKMWEQGSSFPNKIALVKWIRTGEGDRR